MDHREALEWINGDRSSVDQIPGEPWETYEVRVAQADAARTQQAYWTLRALKYKGSQTTPFHETPKMVDCPDCGVPPGEPHKESCDVERCSVCGGRYLSCGCGGHDPAFSRWSGFWPGRLEADALGIGLHEFYAKGYAKKLFIKPIIAEEDF